MRALIQRVREARVEVDGQVVGQINHGLLVLVGLGHGDTLAVGQKMLDKLLAYRVFSDEHGKMNLNVSQVEGGLLLVSQFTLMAHTHKGLRPDFAGAMPPVAAAELFAQWVQMAQARYPHVATGQFGADMQVHLINDGPVTFMLEVNA